MVVLHDKESNVVVGFGKYECHWSNLASLFLVHAHFHCFTVSLSLSIFDLLSPLTSSGSQRRSGVGYCPLPVSFTSSLKSSPLQTQATWSSTETIPLLN